ncbi:hypothetical protein [Tateyamaria pelophila]|uniref:hypothetical protein n=1 Tax=Tateyamaria pelophila TaxID=328415 RepID=UPI001CBF7807|nr:hypothetical protein [Tateyamaria pelophila]
MHRRAFQITLLPMLLLSFLEPTAAHSQTASVCDTAFVRPAYPTRQAFCSIGEMVEDAYNPGVSYPCQEIEVDHFISLSYAHKNGVCDPDKLRRLANDPDNLRLTHWQTNRAKAALSPEEFATRRLSADQADRVTADAAKIRQRYGLPKLHVSSDLKTTWLISERDRLEHKNAQLLKNAAELRNTPVTYRGKKMEAAKAVSYHTSRVSRIVTRSALRNVGSMAGEALPFIGIGVIVGVTGWEISDACASLKENYELNIAFNPEEAIAEGVQSVCTIKVPSSDEIIEEIKNSPAEAWASAKGYVPSLPEISDVKIDWNSYMETAKSSAIWLMEKTGASMQDFAVAIYESWGSYGLENVSIDTFWPWSE